MLFLLDNFKQNAFCYLLSQVIFLEFGAFSRSIFYMRKRKVSYKLLHRFAAKENFDKISDNWKCPLVNILLSEENDHLLKSFSL